MMLERFYKYREWIASDRKFKAAEQKYEFKIGRATVKCSIDRIETTMDGKLYIIDFKTGKSRITKIEAQTDAQMQIYQYAVGSEVAGASLLYLNSKNKSPETRDQGRINREEVAERVETTAVKMGGNTYIAVVNKNCEFCNVITSCPLQQEGRGLYE